MLNRIALAAATALAPVLTVFGPATAATAIMPAFSPGSITATQFMAGVGFDAHLSANNLPLTANMADVVAKIRYLGLNDVRDGISNQYDLNGKWNGSPPLAMYETIAKTLPNLRWTLSIGCPNSPAQLQTELAMVDKFQEDTHAVTSVEGPNEITNYVCTYNGVSGYNGAIVLQKALYNAVHADPNLQNVRVVYMTGAPAGSTDPILAKVADIYNNHPYPYLQNANGRRIARPGGWTAGTAADYTETGYRSMAVVGNDEKITSTPTPLIQAYYDLDIIMDAQVAGAKVDLYDFEDALAPGQTTGGDYFGLFGSATGITGAAKPVAVAIHNLTSILAPPVVAAADYAPLSVTVTGLPVSNLPLFNLPQPGGAEIIEEPNGIDFVSVWGEAAMWDYKAAAQITPTSSAVTVKLPGVRHWQVIDPALGTAAINAGYSAVVPLSISARPLLVEVMPQ